MPIYFLHIIALSLLNFYIFLFYYFLVLIKYCPKVIQWCLFFFWRWLLINRWFMVIFGISWSSWKLTLIFMCFIIQLLLRFRCEDCNYGILFRAKTYFILRPLSTVVYVLCKYWILKMSIWWYRKLLIFALMRFLLTWKLYDFCFTAGIYNWSPNYWVNL